MEKRLNKMELEIRGHFRGRVPNASNSEAYKLRQKVYEIDHDNDAFQGDDLSFLLTTYKHQRLGYCLTGEITPLSLRAEKLFREIALREHSAEWTEEQLAIQNHEVEGWVRDFGGILRDEVARRGARDERRRAGGTQPCPP